jgi:hypothetical protein
MPGNRLKAYLSVSLKVMYGKHVVYSHCRCWLFPCALALGLPGFRTEGKTMRERKLRLVLEYAKVIADCFRLILELLNMGINYSSPRPRHALQMVK